MKKEVVVLRIEWNIGFTEDQPSLALIRVSLLLVNMQSLVFLLFEIERCKGPVRREAVTT